MPLLAHTRDLASSTLDVRVHFLRCLRTLDGIEGIGERNFLDRDDSGSVTNPGSTKNETGISIDCPGSSVCSLKQKHSILLK